MLLSKQEIARYALAHGFIFEFGCDEPGCGKLIRPGELCVVLKWKKRDDGNILAGRIPVKVRCMTCERELHPPPEVVKVAGAGRGAKKVSAEVASGITINPLLRKFILRTVSSTDAGITPVLLVQRIRRKKAFRDLPKREVSSTIKGMKKLKLIRIRGGVFLPPKAQKVRKQKKQKVLK